MYRQLASGAPAVDWRAGQAAGLARRDGDRVAWQDAAELTARADIELGEDLTQVILDDRLLQSVEERQHVVGRLVAAGRSVLWCRPGDRPFLERQVGMDVDLRGGGIFVAFSGVRSCVSWS